VVRDAAAQRRRGDGGVHAACVCGFCGPARQLRIASRLGRRWQRGWQPRRKRLPPPVARVKALGYASASALRGRPTGDSSAGTPACSGYGRPEVRPFLVS
jgi:hypothetical protein